MWNPEKQNILVFLSARCRELDLLSESLAKVVTGNPLDIDGLQDLV